MPRLIFRNARLFSSHDGFIPGKADTLAVNGPRIEAIGSWEEISPLSGSDTQIIDLQGRTLMPGLHDTHIHLWKVGNLQTFMLDLRQTESLDEMLTMLQQYSRQFPEATWITARGFNEARWKDGRMPTRDDIDKVIKDRPVYVIRTCAHIAVTNSRALERAGITRETRAPEGGVIYRDDTGRPNGLFAETALGLVSTHIPPYSKEQLKTMVRSVRNTLYRYGITAATDPAVDPLLLETYYEMDTAGELGFRLQAIPILLPDGGEQPYPLPQYFKSGHFTVNTVKFFSDGGLSGRTAALKRPYNGYTDLKEGDIPDKAQTHGILRLHPDQYLTLARAAQERGLGIATHAIGDAAIELVIGIYKLLHRSFPSGLRRIEHLGLPEEQHLTDMADYNIATSMQTIFLKELGKNYVQAIDKAYLQRCFPVRSVLQHGILTALSSDAPVVSNFNPFAGMEAAITRQGNEGHPIAPDESIGILEALKAYTISAAKISDLPGLGSLETGKLADLIVVDRDPLTTIPDQLSSIQVDATYIGGDCVYSSTS